MTGVPHDRPKAFTAAELSVMEIPELDFVVPGILCTGLNMIAGRPKVGKSTLALQLAVALTTGSEFFGHALSVSEALYVALEDSHRRLKTRQELMLNGIPAPAQLSFWLEAPTRMPALIEQIESVWRSVAEEPRLLVIDTMMRAIPKESKGQDAYDFWAENLGLLHTYAHDHSLCVLLVHHTTKKEYDSMRGGDELDTVLGSTSITGTMDSILILKQENDAGGGVLMLKGRDVPRQEFPMSFDQDRFQWRLEEIDPLYDQSQKRIQILSAVAEGNSNLKDILHATGLPNENSVHNMLTKCVQAGLLIKVARGQYAITEPARRALAARARVKDVNPEKDVLDESPNAITR